MSVTPSPALSLRSDAAAVGPPRGPHCRCGRHNCTYSYHHTTWLGNVGGGTSSPCSSSEAVAVGLRSVRARTLPTASLSSRDAGSNDRRIALESRPACRTVFTSCAHRVPALFPTRCSPAGGPTCLPPALAVYWRMYGACRARMEDVQASVRAGGARPASRCCRMRYTHLGVSSRCGVGQVAELDRPRSPAAQSLANVGSAQVSPLHAGDAPALSPVVAAERDCVASSEFAGVDVAGPGRLVRRARAIRAAAGVQIPAGRAVAASAEAAVRAAAAASRVSHASDVGVRVDPARVVGGRLHRRAPVSAAPVPSARLCHRRLDAKHTGDCAAA
jgi:hypothetical protein